MQTKTQKSISGGQGLAVRIWTSARSRFGSYRKDERGSIIFVFALMSAVMMGMIGGAVDYGRWLSAKSKTQNAIDAAILAAGRVLQLPGKTSSDAVAAAQKYYQQNKSSALYVDNTTFTAQNNEIVGTSASSVKTPFLGAAGVKSLPVNISSKAILAAGGNAGSHVELAMMLDTTGSMAGQKMVDLKQAAIDLAKIVVWQDQSEYTSRVAIVPFSQNVNVSKDHFRDVTNRTTRGNSDNRTCVRERRGVNRYTDEAPSASNGYFDRYTSRRACKPQATILPLTSDLQAIQNRINEMQPTGGTAGHIGTAFAWYALAPKWSSIWPQASAPLAYSLTQETNENGKPKLYKIAVLMTDGFYNTWYSGDSSTTQARTLCEKMKDEGVTVYTVGFAIPVNSQPDVTMQQCATSSSHYYNASDGEALKAAFRDIALKISELRLSE